MISWHFRVYQGPRSFRFDCPAIWFSQSHWSFWKTKAPNGFCPFVPQFMWKWWNMAVTYFQKLKNKRTSTTLRSVLWRPFVALLQNSFPLHPNQDTFPHHFPVHSRRAIAPLAPVQLSTFKVGSTWVKGSGDTFYHLQTILLPFPRIVTLEEHIWIYLLFSRPASFIKPHGTYWAPQMEMLKSWGVVTELFPLNTSDAIKMHILLVSKKPRQWRNCTTEMDG